MWPENCGRVSRFFRWKIIEIIATTALNIFTNYFNHIAETEVDFPLVIRDFGIKYKGARDPDASVTRCYRVTGTLTIIFLDRKGIVNYFGNELPADYPSRLAALIEEKSKEIEDE